MRREVTFYVIILRRGRRAALLTFRGERGRVVAAEQRGVLVHDRGVHGTTSKGVSCKSRAVLWATSSIVLIVQTPVQMAVSYGEGTLFN